MRSIKYPVAVVAYTHAPILFGSVKYALGFGPTLSIEVVALLWVIPALMALSYAELRFVESVA